MAISHSDWQHSDAGESEALVDLQDAADYACESENNGMMQGWRCYNAV